MIASRCTSRNSLCLHQPGFNGTLPIAAKQAVVPISHGTLPMALRRMQCVPNGRPRFLSIVCGCRKCQ